MHAVEQAKEIAQQEEYVNDRVLVIFLPDCHESLAGIVAGRIREAYYRPTLVVTRSEHGAKGPAVPLKAIPCMRNCANAKNI